MPLRRSAEGQLDLSLGAVSILWVVTTLWMLASFDLSIYSFFSSLVRGATASP